MALEEPPVTLTAAPMPVLSKVNVLPASAMRNELALVKKSDPSETLVSSVTVVKAEPTQRGSIASRVGDTGIAVPVCPADQLPLPLLVQTAAKAG